MRLPFKMFEIHERSSWRCRKVKVGLSGFACAPRVCRAVYPLRWGAASCRRGSLSRSSSLWKRALRLQMMSTASLVGKGEGAWPARKTADLKNTVDLQQLGPSQLPIRPRHKRTRFNLRSQNLGRARWFQETFNIKWECYNPREAYCSAGVNPAVQSGFSYLMRGISSIKVYMLGALHIVRAFFLSCVILLALMKPSKNSNALWLSDFPDQTPWDK